MKMNNVLTEYPIAISPGILITGICMIFLLCRYVFKNRKTILSFFDHLYHRRKTREQLLATIHENQAAIRQIMDNRLHDREQSFAIQRELSDGQRQLSESLSALSAKIDDMQRHTDRRFAESEQKNNKRIRAELKDKIGQSYRYYHSLGSISAMELEALEDLIEEYEEAEGHNSFVHSVVQKEMYTWEKVERI